MGLCYQVLPGPSSAQVSQGLTAPPRHPLLGLGLLQWLQVHLCSPQALHGCRGTAGSPWASPGNPRAICAWSSSCPPPALPGVCRAVPLPWSHPALLWPQFQLCNNLGAFSSPLCYPQGVPTICAGLGLGQWWLCPGQLLELALPGTGGASGTCSQEPPLPLPWYPNPARPSQHPLTCRWLQRQLKRHGKVQVTTKHDTHIHSLLSLGRWGRESGKKGKFHGLR